MPLLKILVISDIHGNIDNTRALQDIERDITIVAGDLSYCGSIEEAVKVLEALENQDGALLWVPGNCDDPSLVNYRSKKSINIHGRSVEARGLVVAGVGGGLYSPFNTPFEMSDEKYGELLAGALRGLKQGAPLVLVAHHPPYGSGVDQVFSGDYVGSKTLKSIIERHKPIFVASGHIHEAWGVGCISGVPVVNPGPLKEGRYALVHIDTSRLVARIRLYKL